MTDKIENELYSCIRQLIKYPNSTICKHYASILIVSAMKNSGMNIDKNLIESILSDSEGDTRTLSILEEIISR